MAAKQQDHAAEWQRRLVSRKYSSRLGVWRWPRKNVGRAESARRSGRCGREQGKTLHRLIMSIRQKKKKKKNFVYHRTLTSSVDTLVQPGLDMSGRSFAGRRSHHVWLRNMIIRVIRRRRQNSRWYNWDITVRTKKEG